MSTTVEEIEKNETGEEKKDELLLDSLEIKGYRCFEHLTIEKLGRVNLIVGKNNVGKTALLEALWIFFKSDSWDKMLNTIHKILKRRNERVGDESISFTVPKGSIVREMISRGDEFRHLFFNRPEKEKSYFSIVGNPNKSSFNDSKEGIVNISFNPNTQNISPDNMSLSKEDRFSFLVSASGLDNDSLTQIWDEIILITEEDAVVKALRIISSKMVDVNFINYPKGSEIRVPVVRVENIDERVPLSSLGEGMNRLLGLALSLVICKDGILLIDEIESGLHYSVLPDVWKLIFKTAKDLNVQVFATTHSKDCIEAFAVAANESPEEGMLIRLEHRGEQIVAKTIDEENLGLAVDYDVEVR